MARAFIIMSTFIVFVCGNSQWHKIPDKQKQTSKYKADLITEPGNLNVLQDYNNFKVTMKLPGVNDKDISISKSGNTVTVEGVKKDNKGKTSVVYRVEETIPSGYINGQWKYRGNILTFNFKKTQSITPRAGIISQKQSSSKTKVVGPPEDRHTYSESSRISATSYSFNRYNWDDSTTNPGNFGRQNNRH